MNVKKIRYIALALVVAAFCSCQKEPSTSDLHRDYLVYTAHDTGTDFAAIDTYYIPDSILIIGNSDKTEYWKDADAMAIIGTVVGKLDDAGYTRTEDKDAASVGIQLSYVRKVTYFVGYDYPYWWWYYPYYWAPGYWGDWVGWHYPYSVYYGYTAGSLLMEMLDLQADQESGKKLPIVWDSFIGGLLTSDADLNQQRTNSRLTWPNSLTAKNRPIMKTSKYLKTIAFCALMLAAAMPGKAQVFPNTYINIDWQVGVPLGAGFADKASGWGMNFEGGYFVTPAITVGPFISYQTNLQSISRQTLDLGNGSALTTNQKHALFQLPFGVTGRYNWLTDSVFQPYAGLKLGANYAEMSSYYYIIKQYTDTWGFYLSPEIGVSIFPRPDYRLGFHVALYYSYSTNSGDVLTYSMDNINNFGIRVGISF